MYRIILLIILIISVNTVFAQSEGFKKITNESTIAEKLNTVSKNTNSIDSDFKQYKHLDMLENDIVSDGHFSFQAIDKVRWEYFTPYKYFIVMNAGTMWINDGNKTQKYDTKSNKMFKEINDLMLGMLQGKILESDQFDVDFYENQKHIKAKLYPKTNEMKEFLSSIEIYFEKTAYNVSKIKMNEHSGDYTLIQFYNRKTNVNIPKSKFLVR